MLTYKVNYNYQEKYDQNSILIPYLFKIYSIYLEIDINWVNQGILNIMSFRPDFELVCVCVCVCV